MARVTFQFSSCIYDALVLSVIFKYIKTVEREGERQRQRHRERQTETQRETERDRTRDREIEIEIDRYAIITFLVSLKSKHVDWIFGTHLI